MCGSLKHKGINGAKLNVPTNQVLAQCADVLPDNCENEQIPQLYIELLIMLKKMDNHWLGLVFQCACSLTNSLIY